MAIRALSLTVHNQGIEYLWTSLRRIVCTFRGPFNVDIVSRYLSIIAYSAKQHLHVVCTTHTIEIIRIAFFVSILHHVINTEPDRPAVVETAGGITL